MSYVDSVISIVRWLAIAVVSIDLMLVVYIFYRRVSRNRYYARKDAAQKRFVPIITKFFEAGLSTGSAVELLRTRGRAEREALRTVIVANMNTTTRQRATELLITLGYVQEWARQAFGNWLYQHRHSRAVSAADGSSMIRRLRRLRVFAVRRAVAVGNLGRLSPEWSGSFMKRALRDPSPQVARLAIAALGRNRVPHGVAMLLKELQKAAEGETEVPIRSIKTALVRYPIGEFQQLPDWMDKAHPRFRFLAVDTVREVCRKAKGAARTEFPPELRQWFFEQAVNDESADVRARSAAVISWFRTDDAVGQLRHLLRDDNEFVRLHAVRACADAFYSTLLEDILRLVTDPRWRVREAAVRVGTTLPAGRQALERLFLDTKDRYASEQIADEVQRSGIISQILPLLALSNGERGQAFEVCAKMARLKMDSLLIEDLVNGASTAVRTQLLEALAPSRSSQLVTSLQRIAGTQNDPLRARTQQLLEAGQTIAAASAGRT